MSNFIDLKNISKDQLIDLVSLSIKWKKELPSRFMKDKQVVLIFEKRHHFILQLPGFFLNI